MKMTYRNIHLDKLGKKTKTKQEQ